MAARWDDPLRAWVPASMAAGSTHDSVSVLHLRTTGSCGLAELAGIRATAEGFRCASNTSDGFEGTPDENGRRGATGWMWLGLPWRRG